MSRSSELTPSRFVSRIVLIPPLDSTFWLFSGIFLGIYAILENINIPIIVQPHCYGALTAVIFCQVSSSSASPYRNEKLIVGFLE